MAMATGLGYTVVPARHRCSGFLGSKAASLAGSWCFADSRRAFTSGVDGLVEAMYEHEAMRADLIEELRR